MTVETKFAIDPEDVLSIRFECGNCGASVSVPVKMGLAEYARGTALDSCKICNTAWGIVPNSAEHKALYGFALGMESIASSMAGRSLKIKLEVKGVAKS